MRILHILKLRLRSLFRRAAVEAELHEEFQDYLEGETEAGIARGLTPAEARHAAMRKLHSIAVSQEECRDARGTLWFEHLARDARYALRTLRKNPGFTAAAVLALTLGIGSTTAVFSLVNAVLLKPLSMPDADQFLVMKVASEEECCTASPAKFAYWRTLTDDLENVSAFYATLVTNTTEAGSETWPALKVTADTLRCFGMRILQGRDFASDEDRTGGPDVAIISETLRQARFKDDPHVVGRELNLNGKPYTVRPIVYVPIAQIPDTEGAELFPTTPLSWVVRTEALPDATIPAIQRELRAATGLSGIDLHNMNDVISHSTARRQFSMQLMTMFGAIALALAAIGIYGLMAYSVEQRRREIGIRLALGAQAGSVRRMVLRQGLGLALAGVVLGLSAALGLSRLLESFLFRVTPNDPIAFAVTPAVLGAIALLAGWLPARRASRVDPVEALRHE